MRIVIKGADLNELVGLAVFLCLSTAFALCAIIAGFVCAPKAPNDEKNTTYECGMKLFSDANIQYDIRFFMYAILFLIFDVETILLYPFAVVYSKLGLFAFIEAGIFVAILALGLYYAVRKNILRWR